MVRFQFHDFTQANLKNALKCSSREELTCQGRYGAGNVNAFSVCNLVTILLRALFESTAS